MRPESGAMGAAENLHQRALAGAVFADERQHFAAAGLERNLAQGGRGAESLRNRLHLQHGFHHGNTEARSDGGSGTAARSCSPCLGGPWRVGAWSSWVLTRLSMPNVFCFVDSNMPAAGNQCPPQAPAETGVFSPKLRALAAGLDGGRQGP